MEVKLNQSTYLTESQKALEAHGCVSWVTQLVNISPYITM